MTAFITIHNTAKGSAFTTFDSVQAAKTHLQNLICSQQVKTADTLAIVRASDDSIVYFKKRNNTLDSLNAAFRKRNTESTYSLYQVAKERLLFVFTALTNAVSRR